MLFLRYLRKNIYFLAVVFVLLAVASRVWEPMALIVPLPYSGFMDYTELLLPFLVILPLSFLLYDNFETELGLVCGARTTKMMFCKFGAVLLSTLASSYLIIALYQNIEYVQINQEKIRIPIYVPDNFKVYMLISAFVTTLFFSSLILFVRVATRNCYAPVGLGVLVYSIVNSLNTELRGGSVDIRNCLYDPFLSNYFIGDKVLTEYYQVGPLWTYNRLLFFGLAVVMLIGSYMLLRKEKLHQGFND